MPKLNAFLLGGVQLFQVCSSLVLHFDTIPSLLRYPTGVLALVLPRMCGAAPDILHRAKKHDDGTPNNGRHLGRLLIGLAICVLKFVSCGEGVTNKMKWLSLQGSHKLLVISPHELW